MAGLPRALGIALLVALLVVPLLAAPAAATGHVPGYITRHVSPPYATAYSVEGRVEDADGRAAYRAPVRVDVVSPQGPVVQPIEVLTTCYGDFDVYWEIHNLTDRYTVKVTVGGQVAQQAVDVLHRRNDFTVRLDRALPEPATEHECRTWWEMSERRVTVTGRSLQPTPPYPGPAGNTLHARPHDGLEVFLKHVRPDGSEVGTVRPVYTNEFGVYKYAFLEEQGPIQGKILVWFENDPPGAVTIELKEGDVKYHVVSQPPVRIRSGTTADAPGPALLAGLAALGVAVLLAGTRRVGP